MPILATSHVHNTNTNIHDSFAGSSKQPPEVFYKKVVLEKFRNILTKTPVLEALFNKIVRLATLLKRDSSTGVFL